MLPGLIGTRFGQAFAAARAFFIGALSGRGRLNANDNAEQCRWIQEHAETRRRADEAFRRADAVIQSAGDQAEEDPKRRDNL